jgi:hypothetical protein
MSLIETTTFRLDAGSEESALLDADQRAQTEFFYLQPGLVRRTTARGSDGEWLVVVLWSSEAEADAAHARSAGDGAMSAFTALLDGSSVRTRRYRALD